MLQHSSTAYTQLIATSLYATLASQWSWGIIVLQKNHKSHMLGGIVIKTDSSVHLKCLIGLKQANLMQKSNRQVCLALSKSYGFMVILTSMEGPSK